MKDINECLIELLYSFGLNDVGIMSIEDIAFSIDKCRIISNKFYKNINLYEFNMWCFIFQNQQFNSFDNLNIKSIKRIIKLNKIIE